MISNQNIQNMITRLKEMKGPADGKGAFLGNGRPSSVAVELRSIEIAQLLEELIRLRQEN